MSQVNVNQPEPSNSPDSGGAAVAAGINLITVLIILAVAVVIIAGIIWFVTSSGYFSAPSVAPQKTSQIIAASLALL